MGLFYSLGYIIPFLGFFAIIFPYLYRSLSLYKISFIFYFHILYSIICAKIAHMFLVNNFDLTLFMKPGGLASVGLICGAYSFLIFPALLIRKNPILFWNKLSLFAPVGLILIRVGNILNREAYFSFYSYATLEIIGAFLLTFFFIFSKKIRENATIFSFFFYAFWRSFIVDPSRNIFYFTPANDFLFLGFFSLFLFILVVYFIAYLLNKHNILTIS